MLCKAFRFSAAILFFCFVTATHSYADAIDDKCTSTTPNENFLQCLQGAEAGGQNPLSANSSGYVGLFGWGVNAMHEMGMCTLTPNMYYPASQPWDKCTFTGKFGITKLSCCGTSLPCGTAGVPAGSCCAVTNCTGALLSTDPASLAAQQQMRDVFMQSQWNKIKSEARRSGIDLLKMCGTTSSEGVPFTRESLLAAANLRGVHGGAITLLLGKDTEPDKNGVKPEDYAICMAVCMRTGMGIHDCRKKGCGTE